MEDFEDRLRTFIVTYSYKKIVRQTLTEARHHSVAVHNVKERLSKQARIISVCDPESANRVVYSVEAIPAVEYMIADVVEGEF